MNKNKSVYIGMCSNGFENLKFSLKNKQMGGNSLMNL